MTPQAGFVPHVTTMGHGPRRVLALHCTLAFGGAWSGVAKALGQDLTLIAPDMPSHGGSVDWDEISDFSDTVYSAAVATLDDTPMDVIGHSFGAVTALRLAVAMPEKIRSLTLIEPVFFAVALQDAPETMADHDTRAAPFFDAINDGDIPQAARSFNRMWSDGPIWDSLSERSRDAMIRAIHVVPGTFGFLYEDAVGMLAPDVMNAATMPTLLIRGPRRCRRLLRSTMDWRLDCQMRHRS